MEQDERDKLSKRKHELKKQYELWAKRKKQRKITLKRKRNSIMAMYDRRLNKIEEQIGNIQFLFNEL